MIRRLFNNNKVSKLRESLNPVNILSKYRLSLPIKDLNNSQHNLSGWINLARKPKGFGKFNRRKQKNSENKNDQEQEDVKGTRGNTGENFKDKFNSMDLLNSESFKQYQNPNFDFFRQNKWLFILGAAIFASYLLLNQITKVPVVDLKYLEFERYVKLGRVKSVKIQAITHKLSKRYVAHVQI